MADTQRTDKERREPPQGQLFHFSPQQVCDELGLNWLTALWLHESGRLSFDPAQVSALNAGQETELRFVGALAAAGCDDRMLDLLLESLSKPYRYSLGGIYFDWLRGGRWRDIQRIPDEREEMLSEWVEELTDAGDVDGLSNIRDTVSEALEQLGEEDEADA